MRFIKVVTPANVERRNFLLKKLASLKEHKGLVKDDGLTTIKGRLRREIKSCGGSVSYFLEHKGVKVPVGGEFYPKKYFLLKKCKEVIQPLVRRHRETLKAKYDKSKVVRVHLKKADYKFDCLKEGGVNVNRNTYGEVVKKVKRQKVFKLKKPETPDYYIGLEIEVTSKYHQNTVADMLIDAGLADQARVMTDGSLRVTDYAYSNLMEICVLSKASEIKETLTKLGSVLKEGFLTNDTCGLHVHLDMRYTDVKKSFANLVSMQSILYKLSKEDRLENKYCHPVRTPNFDLADGESHWAGVSKSSFYKHSTIEVRMHHATTDVLIIEKWIKLLKSIADYSGDQLLLGTVSSEFEQLKDKVKPDDNVLEYVREHIA